MVAETTLRIVHCAVPRRMMGVSLTPRLTGRANGTDETLRPVMCFARSGRTECYAIALRTPGQSTRSLSLRRRDKAHR